MGMGAGGRIPVGMAQGDGSIAAYPATGRKGYRPSPKSAVPEHSPM
jgi:hypothetical protein